MTDTVRDAEAAMLNAFAHSSGSEAQAVMAQAVDAACSAPGPAASPLLAMDSDSARVAVHGLSVSDGDLRDIRATTPAELHFAACVEQKTDQIESCPYYFTNPGSIEGWAIRKTSSWAVTLRDIRTGEIIAQETLTGAQPEPCEQKELFATGTTVKTKVGPLPTLDALREWLASAAQ